MMNGAVGWVEALPVHAFSPTFGELPGNGRQDPDNNKTRDRESEDPPRDGVRSVSIAG